MFTKIRINQFMIAILCLICVFNASACSAQKKMQSEQSNKQQEEKKVPKSLDKLKTSIEKIEKALTALHEKNKAPFFIQQQEIQKKQEAQSKKDSGGSGGEEKSGSGGSDGGSNEQSKQPSPSAMPTEEVKLKLEQEKYQAFEGFKKDVTALHNTWNSYEPTAVADSAPQPAIKEFKDALDSLTKSIEAKDDYQSLLDVIQLYKYIPDFYALYKTDTPPDLDRIKFAVKKLQLISEKKDYEMAKSVLKYLDTVWATLKPKLKEDDLEAMNKFEFALADIKNAVESQDDALIKAKASVILTIISDIEKKAEKKSK